MATILRDWSYQYPWLYNAIAKLSAITVGGESRFRQLALEGLPINDTTRILDLCCGNGQVTRFLVERSPQVVGLDASPWAVKRAKQNVPAAEFVEGWAESMPFAEQEFDIVHTSVALHEMAPEQLTQILQEVYRVLKPGGIFALIDFHSPENPLFWVGLAPFLILFETETAWQLIRTDLSQQMTEVGFVETIPKLHAGGSLQVIQAQKPASSLKL